MKYGDYDVSFDGQEMTVTIEGDTTPERRAAIIQEIHDRIAYANAFTGQDVKILGPWTITGPDDVD